MVFNWVDLIFAVVLLYFAISNSGFILTLIELSGFILSLFVSYNAYRFFGEFLGDIFSLPSGYSNVLGFFGAWTITEIIFFFVAHYLLRKVISKMRNHAVDVGLGYTLGFIQGAIVFLFFISLIFGLPVRGSVKQDILNSKVGPFFVDLSRSSETKIKEVFGEAANETLNFLTIKPSSGESIGLGFTVAQNQISYDMVSEQTMLNLINKERQAQGLSTLSYDPRLQAVAREYASLMLVNGFFSHISSDGSSAADRAQREDIQYATLGENLAFAPDVYIAHQGLMNSLGHRKNILSPDFGKAGIGVADAGVYGKMFVQMFSD